MMLRLLAGVLVLVCAPLACAAQTFTEQMLIRPVHGGTVSADAVSAVAPAYTLSEQTIIASDGAKLHAVLLRQPRARGVLLYFGGNGFTIERLGARLAAIIAPLGLDLMIVDHRGYGSSEGVPTAALLETDGLAAFDTLAKLPGIRRDRILVHGQSLGSFTAGYVAAHRDTAGLILESSVTTTEDWVRPGMTIADTLKGHGNLRFMEEVTEPLLLLVGRNDTTTPPRFSEALFAASPLAPRCKMIAIVDGAGHNDVLTKPAAIGAYSRFLAVALR